MLQLRDFQTKGSWKRGRATKVDCFNSKSWTRQDKRKTALQNRNQTAGKHVNMLTCRSCQWLHYVWGVRVKVCKVALRRRAVVHGLSPSAPQHPRQSLRVPGLISEICNNSFATITLESARKLYLEEPMGCAACGIRGAVAMATRSQHYLESGVRFSTLPLGLAALFLLAPFTEQPAPFLHLCTL